VLHAIQAERINGLVVAALVGGLWPSQWKKGLGYQAGVILGAIANVAAARGYAIQHPELALGLSASVGAAAGAAARILVELFRVPSRPGARS
jgi:hypothetical protein